MIVTAAVKPPLRLHLLVVGIAVVAGVLWPTTPSATTADAVEPVVAAPVVASAASSVAFLAVGSSADVWLEPVAGADGVLAGFRLRSVWPQSAWARAGLRDGDLVVAVDGHPVTLSLLLDTLSTQPRCAIDAVRDGQPLTAMLQLERPQP